MRERIGLIGEEVRDLKMRNRAHLDHTYSGKGEDGSSGSCVVKGEVQGEKSENRTEHSRQWNATTRRGATGKGPG